MKTLKQQPINFILFNAIILTVNFHKILALSVKNGKSLPDSDTDDTRQFSLDITNDLEDDDTPAALIHLVRNEDLSNWLRIRREEQDFRNLFVSSNKKSLIGVRQSPISTTTFKPALTPVLPITGKRLYDETDCMVWDEIAVIMRSDLPPQDKSDMIEPKTCNLKHGLECLPVEDRGSLRNRCKCMLVYGPNPIRLVSGKNSNCYIPAGLGWASECHNKTWTSYGYPTPYGDPSGANAEQAAQTDAYNLPNGEQIVVDYIRWNSIKPSCVPNAKCRERGTYIGQRCQCQKGSTRRQDGTCSLAVGILREGNIRLSVIWVVAGCLLRFDKTVCFC